MSGSLKTSVRWFAGVVKGLPTPEQVIREFETTKVWDDPIVTEIVPSTVFYRAEEYHQDYFRKNPYAGYCRAVIAPKVAKFRKKYAERLKA